VGVRDADIKTATAAMKGADSFASVSVPEYLASLKQQHAAANNRKEGASLLGAYALAVTSLQALSLVAVLGSLHQDCAEAEVRRGGERGGLLQGSNHAANEEQSDKAG